MVYAVAAGGVVGCELSDGGGMANLDGKVNGNRRGGGIALCGGAS